MGFKRRTWVLVAVAAAAVSLLLMALNMRFFLRVVSLAGVVLMTVSIVVMLLTYRRSREIRPKAMGIAMAMSFVSLFVYSLFLPASLGRAVWLTVFLLGVLAGIGWSLVTPMFREGGAVKREGNLWYLGVWGATFLLNQLLVLYLGRTPLLSMALLVFATGLVTGSSSSYIVRYYKLLGLTPDLRRAAGTAGGAG